MGLMGACHKACLSNTHSCLGSKNVSSFLGRHEGMRQLECSKVPGMGPGNEMPLRMPEARHLVGRLQALFFLRSEVPQPRKTNPLFGLHIASSFEGLK